MNTRTFHGSCFCGAIEFEADIDFSQGTTKCNCTSCWKRRWWSVAVKPEQMRPIAGAELLGGPTRQFCPTCGVIPYGKVDAAEWNDGEYYSVNVAVLDDLDPRDLLAAPVRICDGRNDDWFRTPEVTGHL